MSRTTVAISFVLAVALAGACGCGRGAGGGGGGSGGGGGTGGGVGTGSAADCEAARAHVGDLYRAEASDPKVAEQMIADNTAMVMTECMREPGRVAGCALNAKSAPELESTCLAPLDDDGTEGDRFKRP